MMVHLLVFIGIYYAISWWQNHGLLEVRDTAPDFSLLTLTGETVSLEDYRGRRVLIYFFAPWCSICRFSADNLNDLRAAREKSALMILMMGLSWQSVEELKQFVSSQNISPDIPILIGQEQQFVDYKIKGFPTYYVIDESGVIQSRTMGYTTELGMRWRTSD